jgi:hypothetical protein
LANGVLVPAEKLVNGATVTQVPRTHVEYWHVELDSHDVLLAESLPAESYLDCGNRTAFVEGGAYLEAHPDFKPKRFTQTCFPLVFDGPAVALVKVNLLVRAHQLGFRFTADDDAYLLADGQRIDPSRVTQSRLAFELPQGIRRVELRSRTFIPTQINPTSDDRRVLGLCVSRLQIDGNEVALNDEPSFGEGWHPLEQLTATSAQRWTHDSARLPGGSRLILVDLGGRGYYWDPAAQDTLLAGTG